MFPLFLFQILSDHKMFHFGILDSAAAFDPAGGLEDGRRAMLDFRCCDVTKFCGCLLNYVASNKDLLVTHVLCNKTKGCSHQEGRHVMRSADIIKFSYQTS